MTASGNDSVPRGTYGEAETDQTRPGLEILSLELDDVNLAVVDIGTSMQSLAIVETLTKRTPSPPVIALVDAQRGDDIAALYRHGAAACLRKPFNPDELARLIHLFCGSAIISRVPESTGL